MNLNSKIIKHLKNIALVQIRQNTHRLRAAPSLLKRAKKERFNPTKEDALNPCPL